MSFAVIQTPLYNFSVMIAFVTALIGLSHRARWAWVVLAITFVFLIPNFYGIGSWIMLALALFCGYVFWAWGRHPNK